MGELASKKAFSTIPSALAGALGDPEAQAVGLSFGERLQRELSAIFETARTHVGDIGEEERTKWDQVQKDLSGSADMLVERMNMENEKGNARRSTLSSVVNIQDEHFNDYHGLFSAIRNDIEAIVAQVRGEGLDYFSLNGENPGRATTDIIAVMNRIVEEGKRVRNKEGHNGFKFDEAEGEKKIMAGSDDKYHNAKFVLDHLWARMRMEKIKMKLLGDWEGEIGEIRKEMIRICAVVSHAHGNITGHTGVALILQQKKRKHPRLETTDMDKLKEIATAMEGAAQLSLAKQTLTAVLEHIETVDAHMAEQSAGGILR